jgi:pimeloyl-[acyl-carrier protein] synthase
LKGKQAFIKASEELNRKITDIMMQWLLYRNGKDHQLFRTSISKHWKTRTISDDIFEASFSQLKKQLSAPCSLDGIAQVVRPMHFNMLASLVGFPKDKLLSLAESITAALKVFELFYTPDTIDNIIYSSDKIAHAVCEHFEKSEEMQRLALEFGENWLPSTMLFMLAGTENSTNFLGLLLYHLLSSPHLHEELTQSDALITRYVEESLRIQSSLQATVREATEPLQIGNEWAMPGQKVILWLFAANHDPNIFEQPDEFLLHRKPIPHLSFGHGPHFCLGADLTRREATGVIKIILDCLKTSTISVSDAVYKRYANQIGLQSFQIHVQPK